jgi:ribosomal 30S subunit maturation factor RimM
MLGVITGAHGVRGEVKVKTYGKSKLTEDVVRKFQETRKGLQVLKDKRLEVEVELRRRRLTRRRLWLSASHGGGWAEAARRTSRENLWGKERERASRQLETTVT